MGRVVGDGLERQHIMEGLVHWDAAVSREERSCFERMVMRYMSKAGTELG